MPFNFLFNTPNSLVRGPQMVSLDANVGKVPSYRPDTMKANPMNMDALMGRDEQQQQVYDPEMTDPLKMLRNQSLYLGVSALQGLSSLSGNSYQNSLRKYNQQKLAPDLNKNLYSTNQDLYGTSYARLGGLKRFDDGGNYQNLANEYNFLAQENPEDADFFNNQAAEYAQEFQAFQQKQMQDAMYETLEQHAASAVAPVQEDIYPYIPQPYQSTLPNYGDEETTPQPYSPTYAPALNIGMNVPSNNKSWAQRFKQVEDSGNKFNHGNGAYGTFGYRKSGHLQQAFKTAPEFQDMRNNYKSFDSFWDTYSKSGYGELSNAVDGRYEQWLKRQTNNDLATAGRFNLTGSKKNKTEFNRSNNMSTSGYINKLLRFKGGGSVQNSPKVYTNATEYNKAAQNYNDSLALYNYTKLQKKVEPKSKLDFLLSPIAELKIKDEGMAEQKGTFESIIKRNKSVNGNIREDGTRYGNSRLWSLGQNDTEHQILYEEANKIIKNSNGRIQYSNSAGSPDLVHPYIHNSAMWRGYGNNNDYSNTYPKQPVKYQPQRTVNTTNNTPRTFKQINKNTLQIIPNTSQLPKNTHPTTRMQTLHPVNIGADNPQVVMKGQSINLPEPILPQQHGKPIYGPGSTIIGYSGNDMQFKPAYQYTGAPNNVHNLQDKTLLSDPEALKKYIAARDSGYKFKKGGSVRLKFKKYSNNYQ